MITQNALISTREVLGVGSLFFIAQKLTLKALKEQRKVLVCRRYGSTIRNSVFALFKDVLKDFKLYEYCKVRESDFYIQLPNGSEFIFVGLDDETKLLSIQNISDVFVEEIWEVSKETIDQLSLRMRGKAKNQQIYGAFNPISAKHWLYDFCEGKRSQRASFIVRAHLETIHFLVLTTLLLLKTFTAPTLIKHAYSVMGNGEQM